jgi:hypothetical protein
MADSLRDRVARALVWTTDEIEPGRGKRQPRVCDMYLGDIQKHLGRRIPDELPRYAFRFELIEDDPGGSEVTAGKTRSGLFVLTEESYVLARDGGWGRTLTQGFARAGNQAEPVTCTVKGKRAFGLRIVGADSWLIALDPAISGKGYRQAKIRDRLVSAFNGEVQAGPDKSDTTGNVQTAVPRLLSLPSETSRDIRNPPLDEDGQLVLGVDESILYRGQHRCKGLRNEPVAYGSAWRPTPCPEGLGEVWITDRRVAVAWHSWQSDPSAAPLSERFINAGFDDPREGVEAVGGQLTAAWIGYVFVGRSESSLEFQAVDLGMPVRLQIFDVDSAEAERLMKEVAAAVATYRLATDDSVNSEERQSLDETAHGRPAIEDLDWGLRVELPSSFSIGRDPASLAQEAR